MGSSGYKSWIFILSDGMPNDDWYEAAEKAKKCMMIRICFMSA